MRFATAQIDGQAIAYRESGQGTPVFLIHGLGASSHIYQGVAAELPDHRCLAIDLPGNGKTSASARWPAEPEALAELCARVLDAAEAQRAVIAGHSGGASVALALAMAEPERALGLCLINGGAGLPALARAGAAPVIGDALFRVSGALPPSRTMTRIYLQQIFGDPALVTDDVVDGYFAQAGGAAFYSQMLKELRGLAKYEPSPQSLEQLRCPVEILWGDRDPLFRPGLGKRLARRIAGSRFQLLHGVGHCPPQEAAQAVAEALRSLGRVGDPSGRAARTAS